KRMRSFASSKPRTVFPGLGLFLGLGCLFAFSVLAQAPDSSQTPSVRISTEPAPPKRIPREQAMTTAALDGSVRESLQGSGSRPSVGARVLLLNTQTHQKISAATSGDGVFRIFPVPPGSYELHVEANGYSSLLIPLPSLNANEVLTLE